MKFIYIPFLALIWIHSCFAQVYLLTTYEKQADSTTYSAYVEKIDLDQQAVLVKVKLCNGGIMNDRKPHPFKKNGRKYYAVFMQYGEFEKSIDPENITHFALSADSVSYFILDNSLNIVKNITIPDAFSPGVTYSADSALILSMEKNNEMSSSITPSYIMDNNFNLQRAQPGKDFKYAGGNTKGIDDIGRFKYIGPINRNDNPNGIFSSLDVSEGSHWLLNLNGKHDAVIDSLPIDIDKVATTIFNYHPKAQKFYMINFNYVNYNLISDVESDNGQCCIEPRLLIYNPTNLKLLQIMPLPDYTLDICPARLGTWYAEIVGDYLVYNFPRGEFGPGYRPAMLFIFDTRTNEATWLRVGWR
ncbi:MAG TPA: hypothetical protein DEO84_01260 [candidate division Zixibacteria bacterium]|nr:hypothetical protein [candidate division Zixibacteria bacterium]